MSVPSRAKSAACNFGTGIGRPPDYLKAGPAASLVIQEPGSQLVCNNKIMRAGTKRQLRTKRGPWRRRKIRGTSPHPRLKHGLDRPRVKLVSSFMLAPPSTKKGVPFRVSRSMARMRACFGSSLLAMRCLSWPPMTQSGQALSGNHRRRRHRLLLVRRPRSEVSSAQGFR